MSYFTSTPTVRTISLTTGLCLAALSISAHAATIGYWQQDGDLTALGAGGTPVAGLSGNAQVISVTPYTGSVPTYSSSTPGAIITSGVGGAVVNASNTSSLSYINPGLPTVVNNSSGGKVNVTGSALAANTPLTPGSFTIQAFVSTTSLADYSTLISYNRTDGNGSSWMLDTTNANPASGVSGHNSSFAEGDVRLRVRFDTQPLGQSGVPANGFNQAPATSLVLNDGEWHHIALTYNADTRSFSVYGDYQLLITGTASNPLVYDPNGGTLSFGGGGGGKGFNGLMDEVLLSDSVLGPNDFLRAIPEPSAALLGAFGLLALMRRKRN